MTKLIVGIDEVGRGPIAGPVAVCALAYSDKFKTNSFDLLIRRQTNILRDSKRLSAKQRLIWLDKINQEKKKGNINY